MKYKNGDQEFEVDSWKGVVLLGLIGAGATFLGNKLTNVMHTIAKRDDAVEIIPNVISLAAFKAQKNIKQLN